MTLVVEAQRVFHVVQHHYLTDGGDFMFVRTLCGHYAKESALTLPFVEGVPTCLDCVVGRARWDGVVQTLISGPLLR